jgi:hypothetical protein
MRIAETVRVKVRRHINDGFADAIKAAFKEKFARELDTSYNIFAMALVSAPADGEPFTPEQKEFCEAFDGGYAAAMNLLEG